MLRSGICGAAFAAIFAASPAVAQDHNWSGLYLGAHGGYGWADTDYPGTPAHPTGAPRPDLEGSLVGGQVGYNHQINNIVLGVEADYSFTHMAETARDGNYITQDHELSGFGSIRGRLGFASGNWLIYGTAGWAWNRSSHNQTCPAGAQFGHCRAAAAGPYNLSKSETETGWVYGAGVETAITENWSLRAEYLRYDFDSEGYNLGTAPSGVVIGTKTLEHEVDVVRLGVNYRFGGRSDHHPVSLK
ncbi:outer membrane protein [Hyphomicrobium sulfonivorans]|uniref:outer membrane protein n=1 Tax=Hyphomicrobium sulfonivorans TaxID=121290 RepID=UPI0008386A8B|nr:outer membrane protein [Hyphomicrobium sulfonivorans]